MFLSVLKLIKSHWQGEIGIHTHNNLGKAVTSNSISAIENGATWIDSR